MFKLVNYVIVFLLEFHACQSNYSSRVVVADFAFLQELGPDRHVESFAYQPDSVGKSGIITAIDCNGVPAVHDVVFQEHLQVLMLAYRDYKTGIELLIDVALPPNRWIMSYDLSVGVDS